MSRKRTLQNVCLERGRPSRSPHPCRPTRWRSPKAKQRELGRRAGSKGNSPRLGRNSQVVKIYCAQSLSTEEYFSVCVPVRPWLAGLTSASSRLRTALVPGGCVTMQPVRQSSTARASCVCQRRTRAAGRENPCTMSEDSSGLGREEICYHQSVAFSQF